MKGSCLCSAIEYEIDSIDMPIAHCHCQTCRKAHSAPFSTNAGVMREHFRWLKGEDKLSFFESSPGKLRYFCSMCGSHLVAERENLPHVIVRVATLDENPKLVSELHIWTSHNVPWLHYENIESYPEWQPNRNKISNNSQEKPILENLSVSQS